MVVHDPEVVLVHDHTLGQEVVPEVATDIVEVVPGHAVDHVLVPVLGRDPDRESVDIRVAHPRVVALVVAGERAVRTIRKYQILQRIGRISVTIP